MDRYAVINKDTGEVMNVIAWDGETPWTPPDNHYVLQHDDVGRGDFWSDKHNDFVRPLSKLKLPEDKISLAERKKSYFKSKEKLKANMFFINDYGSHEV